MNLYSQMVILFKERLEIWFIRINGFIISEVLPKIKEGFFHNLAPKKKKKKGSRHGGGGCENYYVIYIVDT